MSRFLTVGIIQMPISRDSNDNIRHIEKSVKILMKRNPRPELVVGVEGGIGYGVREKIPGITTDKLKRIAKEYAIYFVPGTMFEINPKCQNGKYYNSAPIFSPDGTIIDVYHKLAPWQPSEYKTQPGNKYVVFNIDKKHIKIGILLCYDLNFPEIARNLSLLGAEVILKLTEDFEEAYQYNKPIHIARAIENQAFLISTNAVGQADGYNMYGHSMVVNPSGQILLEADNNEALLSITLDIDEVLRARKYGTFFSDHYLSNLKEFNFPMPYATNIAEAPVYKTFNDFSTTPDNYIEMLKKASIGNYY